MPLIEPVLNRGAAQATLASALMHLVHNVFWTVLWVLGSYTETFCRFGRNKRGVRFLAYETFRPTTGTLPQFAHLAIVLESFTFC